MPQVVEEISLLVLTHELRVSRILVEQAISQSHYSMSICAVQNVVKQDKRNLWDYPVLLQYYQR